MKSFLKITILILLAICQSFALQALQRRAGTTAARGYFSRAGNTGLGKTFATKTSGISSTTPESCSIRSRLFSTGSNASSLSNKVQRLGAQVRQQAGEHSGKLFVTGSAIGAAGVGVGINNIYLPKKQRKNVQNDLNNLENSLKNNDIQNVLATIQHLKTNKGIDEKNKNGFTPLQMIIISKKLDPKNKRKALKNIIANGAQIGDEDLALALGVNTLQDLSQKRLNPSINALTVILPQYKNIKVLENLQLAIKENSDAKIYEYIQSKEGKYTPEEQRFVYYTDKKNEALDKYNNLKNRTVGSPAQDFYTPGRAQEDKQAELDFLKDFYERHYEAANEAKERLLLNSSLQSQLKPLATLSALTSESLYNAKGLGATYQKYLFFSNLEDSYRKEHEKLQAASVSSPAFNIINPGRAEEKKQERLRYLKGLYKKYSEAAQREKELLRNNEFNSKITNQFGDIGSYKEE